MYSTGENCAVIWKLFNKRTADDYDNLFESKAESKAECRAYFTVVFRSPFNGLNRIQFV